MLAEEFSDMFDVLYNNVTSNQAPGLTEYEKSVFLTKAQNEIVKNYFTANSKGNNIGQGFDDSAKRQADFSCLMMTHTCNKTKPGTYYAIDSRSNTYYFPTDVFIPINESIVLSQPKDRVLQVQPLRYDEYMRLMAKPYKRPLKYQAWRLINQGEYKNAAPHRYAEIIVHPGETISTYTIRYVRFPKPIIIGDLDGLSIDGYVFGSSSDSSVSSNSPGLNVGDMDDFNPGASSDNPVGWSDTPTGDVGGGTSGSGTTGSDTGNSGDTSGGTTGGNTGGTSSTSGSKVTSGCELDPVLHQDILQRAVELAKIAWTASGNDNIQAVLQAGQRSE